MSEQHLPLHRHSAAAKAAMDQLRTLDTDNPLKQGWTFHTERNGVKIYSKLLPGESIPHFRGDGWIDGDWPLEDIAAVVKSLGARAIWDERNDFGKTCAMFNSYETLCHVGMRGNFPVGDRDFSIVSNVDIDKRSQTVYFASKSVEDPLIPTDKRVRCNLLLGGWIIHRCNSRPAPTTMNFVEIKRSPATNRKASSVHTSTSFYNVRGSRGQIKIDEPFAAAFAPPARVEGPCARLTFVVQIDMRGAVPQTIISSLALQQPLVVATVSQYVSKFGFPPYFDCENIKRGITVLTEEFEHKIGSYNLIYKADGDHKDNLTRVRFCKTMFKEGYEVEVKRAGNWRIVEDDETTGGRGITIEIDHGGREGVPIQVKVTRKKRLLGRRLTPPPPVPQVLNSTASEALLFDWPMPPARDVNSGVVLARQ